MKEEMCSSQQGSKRKASKKELPRRCWSGGEDGVLLACMKELAVQGWKSDNGFRGGFLNRLEEAMRKHFPGTDIKGQPHINSKITAWKKTYSTVMSILNRSGIGFNLKGDLKIDCDNAQWEEATRAEPTAKNWRNKSWPLLEGWKEVFGKDRAGGGGAEDVMESVNELIHENENCSAGQQQNEDSYVNLEDEIPTPAAEDSASQQSTYVAAKASKNLKKRKLEDSIHALVDLVGEIRKDSRARFEVMSDNLASQAAAGKVNKDLYPLLQKIPNLSEFDIFDVGDKLLQMPERFQFFMGLPDEARIAYVHRLMKNANYTSFLGFYPLLSREGAFSLVKVEEISQTFDCYNFTVQNSVLFCGPPATTSVTTNAKFEVRSPKRVQIKFFGQNIDLSPFKGLLTSLQDTASSVQDTTLMQDDGADDIKEAPKPEEAAAASAQQ